ncbi:uncharacterized protein VNE69_02021 [Vairimorpha necatrix]|uniref:BZIP domain-containing protein n=1 Tax=Vairimorpha necatrix TaxID=6039 RepID=A0AAX4J942_9MICR
MENYKKSQVILRNRLAAKKSAEKKKQELEKLRHENDFLRLQNKLLLQKIYNLEKSPSLPTFEQVQYLYGHKLRKVSLG